MIGIKKDTEYFDLLPGTQIQRERESPVFLTSSDDGKDGIPGEISYPFNLPLTDKNLRLLNNIDSLPKVKTLEHDIVLEDSGVQLSNGTLVIESLTSHLVKNNVGQAEGFILSNVSDFWSRVKDKKLSDLSLGGDRTFSWDGYNATSGTGFWRHIHQTWDYVDSDDGDYVFYPVACNNWEVANTVTWLNKWEDYSGTIQIDRDLNINSLVPHVYMVSVIKAVFNEFGYAVEGDLLSDPDFKQLTLVSYNAVYWANRTLAGAPVPLSSIVIKLSEHVPPEATIGEFLVELQKFLPISFLINDQKKLCTIVFSTSIQGAGAKDYTKSFNPNFTLAFNKIDTASNKILGFDRVYDDEYPITLNLEDYRYSGEVNALGDLPTASSTYLDQVYFVVQHNMYYQCFEAASVYFWSPIGDNQAGYTRENQTDTYTSNILPLGMVYGHQANTSPLINLDAMWPYTDRKGNYFRPYILAPEYREFTPWGFRVMFYRGKLTFRTTYTLPFATNHIYNVNSATTALTSYPKVGDWSLSYNADGYGIYEVFWNKWLPVLENGEVLKGVLYLPFHEYLQWDWNKVLLIQNTPYLIKKITEILPYPGSVQIEAVRIPA